MSVTAKVSKDALPMDPDALKSYDNMIALNDLNEPTILHNLRQRFLKDQIYTYVSSILVAANPFKLLPIYTPEVLDKYKDRGSRTQPPHIFAIADNAYANLQADFRDQAVVISGESGAGKTETMKLVLQFLAEASGRAQKASGEKTESLEQQILKSNPLMEAFGNAKTTRNDNSSRFGKWTEIKFNRTGAIVGGSIINYLLEKSRIAYQAPQERNYHIFYQLCAGVELGTPYCQALKKRCKLKDPQEFNYLNQSGVTTVPSINDEKDWDEMCTAMDVLNMTPAEKDSTFNLVAGILHLGNIDFDRDPKGTEETDAKVKNPQDLPVVCELMGLDQKKLEKALCFREISTGKAGKAGSITFAQNSMQRSKDVRDAMSKKLYEKLFDWLIGKINLALMAGIGSATGLDLCTIGVLDIFGFESFPTNSFEQLCINYCNEKLQQHFNQYIFKLEQDEYAREGVPVDLIEFKDNQPTLDMLERPKGEGIFSQIDEEINVPKGSDLSLLAKVLAKHKSHPQFAAPKPKDLNADKVFIVIHYAGAVPYNVTNFLEKNRDALSEDIQKVVRASSDPVIKGLLDYVGGMEKTAEERAGGGSTGGGGGGGGGGGPTKRKTLGFQFKESLSGLMQALNACEPHFVRCMKSNHKKRGGLFESDMMMAQLRYAGLLEVCRIRKIGFPVRREFKDFVFRYRCLDLAAAPKGHKALCDSIEAKGVLQKREWCIGHTKVFMRNAQQTRMEAAREKALMGVVTKMTKVARGFIIRTRAKRWKKILKELRAAIKARTEAALDEALPNVPELPLGGEHLKVVKDARKLKERLEEERRVTGLCLEAIKGRSLSDLRNACKTADEMAFTSDTVVEAKALLALMERERAAVKAIKGACEARDLDALTTALSEGEAFGSFVVDTDTYRTGAVLKVRLEEEKAARKALKRALKEASVEDSAALDAALARLAEMGMTEEEAYKEGQERAEGLTAQRKALAALGEATAALDLEALQGALKKCKKAGLGEDYPAVAAGRALEAELTAQRALEEELLAESEAGTDIKALQKLLGKAEKRGMGETPGVKKTRKRVERLEKETAATAAMTAALKAKPQKATTIAAAMSLWNDLGMTGPMFDAATEAMGKLGEQSKALMDLEAAARAADIPALDDAIKRLEKMGLGEEEQVAAARETKKRIKRQNELVGRLEGVQGTKVKEDLKGLLEEAEACALETRPEHAELVATSRALYAQLELEDGILKAIAAAVKGTDEEALEAAAKKAEGGVGKRVKKALEAARAALAERGVVLGKLKEALEAEPCDADALAVCMEEAVRVELGGHEVYRQAEQALERERRKKDVLKDLKRAKKAGDNEALKKALEAAQSIGLSGGEVKEAKKYLKKLEEEMELASEIKSAAKALYVKAEAKNGISAADLQPLDAAIASAKEGGLSDDSPFLKQALEARERLQAVVLVQASILSALEGDSLKTMKKIMDKAEDLELGNSALMKKLKSRVRELERARNVAVMGDDDGSAVEATPSLDDDEMKRVREERLARAAAPKFHFAKFPRVRNPDDFARGILLNKKKVKLAQMRWQQGTIPTSILDLPKLLAKVAQAVHKDILGYCGDKSMSFPATLAQDILHKGLEMPDLVDEIFIQVCKQLTHNPRPESQIRGWQLMCMCVGTFPPSKDFENHLINFILEHKDGSGAVGNYARYSLRRLEGIINSGPSGFVPNVDEISAYKERPPILATIELVDGTPLTQDLPITPDLNVGKVLDICNHFMELRDPRMQYFGIFVEDIEDPSVPKWDPNSDDAPPYAGLARTPRPLQNENFVGDVVTVKVRQGQPFKFVYKRKLFLKNLDKPSDDPMWERLIYLQALDEVIKGNFPLAGEEEAALLAAQAMVVELQDEMGADADELIAQKCVEYLPKPMRDLMSERDWAEAILEHREAQLDLDPDQVQAHFVSSVKDHPLYGTCFFNVRKFRFPQQLAHFPALVTIALNSEGLHFLNGARETLASYGYADIYRWGGSSTQFSIIIWNPETEDTDDVNMHTSQAADMASLILDYINAIVSEGGGAQSAGGPRRWRSAFASSLFSSLFCPFSPHLIPHAPAPHTHSYTCLCTHAPFNTCRWQAVGNRRPPIPHTLSFLA